MYMCVCLGVGVETPGYHDNLSGQVGGVRAPAWLLLGGLSEFSSGMSHKNPAATRTTPPVASGGDKRESIMGKRKSQCHLFSFTDKDYTRNPMISNPPGCCCFRWGEHSDGDL